MWIILEIFSLTNVFWFVSGRQQFLQQMGKAYAFPFFSRSLSQLFLLLFFLSYGAFSFSAPPTTPFLKRGKRIRRCRSIKSVRKARGEGECRRHRKKGSALPSAMPFFFFFVVVFTSVWIPIPSGKFALDVRPPV